MDLQLYVLYLLERHIAQTAAIQCRGVSKKTIFYTYLPNTKCSLNENILQKQIHHSLKSKTDCRQIIQKQQKVGKGKTHFLYICSFKI